MMMAWLGKTWIDWTLVATVLSLVTFKFVDFKDTISASSCPEPVVLSWEIPLNSDFTFGDLNDTKTDSE